MKRGDEAISVGLLTVRLARLAQSELAMIKGEVPRFHRGKCGDLLLAISVSCAQAYALVCLPISFIRRDT